MTTAAVRSSRGVHARYGPIGRAIWRIAMGKSARGKHASFSREGPARLRSPANVLLYDAENVGASHFSQVMKAARQHEGLFLVRAYGPPALMASQQWKSHALRYGVERVLCDGCKAGKNSADIQLVIDAMDLLAQDSIEAFFIVSADTDFTPLVRRLRQAGKRVHGIGPAASNGLYRDLCDSFTIIGQQKTAKKAKKASKAKKATESDIIDEPTLGLLVECAQQGGDADAWCDVAKLCSLVRKQRPNFSAKQYGCKNVTRLIEKTGEFEVRKTGHGNYVRPRVA